MSFLRVTTRLRALPRTVTLMVFACAAPLTSLAADQDNTDLIGTWTLTKVLDSSEISSIDDKQAAALVGKTLVITPEKVTLAGESCRRAPTFTRHYEDAAQYIRESAHAPVGRLGIPTVVEAVDLSCTEALMKGYNRIVVYWKGFFFDAAKQE